MVIVLDVGERIQKYSYFLQVEVNLSLCLVRHHTLNCSGGVEMYLYTPNLTEVSDQVHASVTLLPGAFSWQSLVNRLYIPKSVWKIRRRRFPVTGNEGSERGRSVGLLSLLWHNAPFGRQGCLSALSSGRTIRQRELFGTHFCWRPSRPQDRRGR